MNTDQTPLQRFGYTLMGAVVAFGITFALVRGLRRPATIELHQTSQPPIVIPPDAPYKSGQSNSNQSSSNQGNPIQYNIPPITTQEAPISAETPAGSATSKGKHPSQIVNLNTASEQDLQTLPGIGPTIAKHIVDYRQTHGPFQQVEDLQAIPGFGKKRLDKIRQWLTTQQ